MQKYIALQGPPSELIKDYFLKLTEETGELSRVIRKNLRPADPSDIQETVKEELWDVICCALALANCYGIDMEAVIPAKEAINNKKHNTEMEFCPD